MERKSLIIIAVLGFSSATFAQTKMTLGDGRIDGGTLEPYMHTWQQCAFLDGEWQSQGSLTEELIVIGQFVLKLRQTVIQPDGKVGQSNAYFERSSFAPLRMEQELTQDGQRLAYSERNLGPDGYSGIAVQGENSKVLKGVISSKMLHGGAMGLPLATIGYQDEPVEFSASMIGFDATYDVAAEWVGKDSLQFEGQELEAWMIDVEWNHRESGDVYAPGPDGSGGRFWVVSKPPDGFPYVPRYKTDSYAVEFVSGTCPEQNP